MGFRFYRRVRIAPGVRVNFSGRNASLTLGVRGAHITFGRRGVTRTFGLPGSGIFYSTHDGYHSGLHTHVLGPTPVGASSSAAASQATAWRVLAVIVAVVLAAWMLLVWFSVRT